MKVIFEKLDGFYMARIIETEEGFYIEKLAEELPVGEQRFIEVTDEIVTFFYTLIGQKLLEDE